MNVIFLDIDGVLNSEEWMLERSKKLDWHEIESQYPFCDFSPDLVKNLNAITDRTDAKIVISSSWRHGRTLEEMKDILSRVNVTGEVIDFTPYIRSKEYTIPRGCEIDKWLQDAKFQRVNWSVEEQRKAMEKSRVKNYVILDDDSDMLYYQREHFVKTTWKQGLTEELAEKATKILESSLENLYYA